MKICNVTFAIAAAALTTLTLATPASAKSLCISVDSGSWYYAFPKVKALKPSGAIPLSGFYISFSGTFPTDGIATESSTGVVKIGLFNHSMNGGFNNFTDEAVLDSSFAGTGSYDSDGDFHSDGTTTWAEVDCATVTIP